MSKLHPMTDKHRFNRNLLAGYHAATSIKGYTKDNHFKRLMLLRVSQNWKLGEEFFLTFFVPSSATEETLNYQLKFLMNGK